MEYVAIAIVTIVFGILLRKTNAKLSEAIHASVMADDKMFSLHKDLEEDYKYELDGLKIELVDLKDELEVVQIGMEMPEREEIDELRKAMEYTVDDGLAFIKDRRMKRGN